METPNLLDELTLIEAHHQQMSCLLKGPPGVGKTRLAHSFPAPLRSFYVDPNRSTLLDLMERRGKDLLAAQLTNWVTFEKKVVPAVVNRQIDASTIVVDGFDFLFTTLVSECQSKGRDGRQSWGDVLERATQTIYQLTSATGATKDHPGYNIVMTCRTKKITDDTGNVTAIAPALQGQFLDRFEAFFDFVLICEKMIKTVPKPSGPAEKKTVYLIHTIPPTRVETAKAPAHWPQTIEVTSGEDPYEALAKFRNPSGGAGTKNSNT